MERSVYEADLALQDTHWWYRGRRALFGRQIAKLALPRDTPVLDVGTSAGTNLKMLRALGFSKLQGVDCSPIAIEFCRTNGFNVEAGDATCMPFANDQFSLVMATDVIEHIDDDATAVRDAARVLAPGGHALVTVPAFPSLWGLQDELSHHKRRYRMRTLTALVVEAGLEVRQAFYFNGLLLPPIWLARQLFKWRRPQVRSESEINSAWLNAVLNGVFSADVALAPYLPFPAGVSIFMLAQKPIASDNEQEASMG